MSASGLFDSILTSGCVGDPRAVDHRFYRRLSSFALELAQPFLNEEKTNVETFLNQNRERVSTMNFVGVGSRELAYLEFAQKFTKHYVSIDPLMDFYLTPSIRYLIEKQKEISLIPKPFAQLEPCDLPEGHSIYFFMLNALSYLDHPLRDLDKMVKAGDIVLVSGWNMGKESSLVLKRYFGYIDAEEMMCTHTMAYNLSRHKWIPFKKMKYCQKVEHRLGGVTEMYIVDTQAIP